MVRAASPPSEAAHAPCLRLWGSAGLTQPDPNPIAGVAELDSKESSSTFNPLSSTFNESQMTHTYGQASFAHGSYSVTSLTDAGTTAASLSDEHALQPDASSSGTDRPAAL